MSIAANIYVNGAKGLHISPVAIINEDENEHERIACLIVANLWGGSIGPQPPVTQPVLLRLNSDENLPLQKVGWVISEPPKDAQLPTPFSATCCVQPKNNQTTYIGGCIPSPTGGFDAALVAVEWANAAPKIVRTRRLYALDSSVSLMPTALIYREGSGLEVAGITQSGKLTDSVQSDFWHALVDFDNMKPVWTTKISPVGADGKRLGDSFLTAAAEVGKQRSLLAGNTAETSGDENLWLIVANELGVPLASWRTCAPGRRQITGMAPSPGNHEDENYFINAVSGFEGALEPRSIVMEVGVTFGIDTTISKVSGGALQIINQHQPSNIAYDVAYSDVDHLEAVGCMTIQSEQAMHMHFARQQNQQNLKLAFIERTNVPPKSKFAHLIIEASANVWGIAGYNIGHPEGDVKSILLGGASANISGNSPTLGKLGPAMMLPHLEPRRNMTVFLDTLVPGGGNPLIMFGTAEYACLDPLTEKPRADFVDWEVETSPPPLFEELPVLLENLEVKTSPIDCTIVSICPKSR